MSQTQKVIKYCAMIFAIYLTISIISSIAFCLFSLGLIFFDNDYISENLEATIIENQNIEKIKIDIAGANLLIKTGEKLKVETNNKYIITEEKNNKLTIKEKNHHIFNNESQLIIYIPESLELEDSIIKTGAGKIEIEKIVSNRLELNLGAGALNIHELSIKKNTKINGGAGEIIIDSGSINNLDLDMGVGNVKINTILTGNSTIDTGVGELTFNIEGSKDEYSLDIDKGIGTIKINKEDIGHQEKIGDGDNKIEIDGGIGSININFVKRVVNTSEKKEFKKIYTLLNKKINNTKDSVYLTLESDEEVDTILIPIPKENLIVGKKYEFTLKRNTINSFPDNIESNFKNSTIIAITNKKEE